LNSTLIVSPHYDDAVLSCGQFIAGYPGMHIATVCTAVPPAVAATEYDRNCGFVSADQGIRVRAGEDLAALKILGAKQVRLGFWDSQYGAPLDVGAVAEAIEKAAVDLELDRLFAPLGLAHPDHVAVNRAALTLVRQFREVWMYEEIPARVWWPEQAIRAVHRLKDLHFEPRFDFAGTGEMPVKKRAVSMYKSQLWALDPHCLYVPERMWRIR